MEVKLLPALFRRENGFQWIDVVAGDRGTDVNARPASIGGAKAVAG